jgi:hypothetical protein
VQLPPGLPLCLPPLITVSCRPSGG